MPPATTIETGPSSPTIQLLANFTFSSNDPLATFECSLDGGLYGSCETPYHLDNVLTGAHRLLVRAMNVAGGVDTTPAEWLWTVSPTPETTLTATPPLSTNDKTATFEFTSDLSGVTFECALDAAVDDEVFVPCTSPKTYTNLIFGSHDFAVRARIGDGFDLTPAEYTWDVGGAAPPVTILSGPTQPETENRTTTFTFEAAGRDLRYECALDLQTGTGTSTGTYSLCLSPKSYGTVPYGTHTFHVRVYVPDEFPEGVSTDYAWSVVERDPPETEILFGPPATSFTSTASFAFSSDEPAATFQCKLDGASSWTACPVPSDFVVAHGSHTL